MKGNRPYLNKRRDLVIPLDAPEKYQWWRARPCTGKAEEPVRQDGCPFLRIDQILEELEAPLKVWKRYTHRPYRGPWQPAVKEGEEA